MAEEVLSTAPIFIVGLPRSGTTLMAVCLGRHPAIHCGPETHLFTRLATPQGRAALDPRHWPDAALEFMARYAPATGDDPSTALPDPVRVRAFLERRSPSAAAILEAMVALPAADAGKRRWAEKTPRHLESLAQIRGSWPDAAIVHIVRDPRSRAVSMTQVPFGAESQVGNLIDGMRRDRRSRAALDADPRLITVRLEDLQAEPEGTLRRVCEFLGEAYDPVMLLPSGRAAAVLPREWWKRSATDHVSATGRSSWQEAMPEDVQRLAGLYCADQLARYGYPGARVARSVLTVVPLGARIIDQDESVALALARHDTIIRGLSKVTWRRLQRIGSLVYWGRRGQLVPMVGHRPAGWWAIMLLTVDLGVRRLRGRPAGWVDLDTGTGDGIRPAQHGGMRRDPSTVRERWLAGALRLLARRIEPAQIDAMRGLTQGSSR